MIVAPNALGLGETALKYLDKRQQRLKAKQLLQYMKKKRLIEYTHLPDGKLEVKVTEAGRQRIQKVNFNELTIRKPKQWDGKWRFVMFDIPERKRHSRSALSMKLRNLGFYQLQKSVWAHAYPCALEVELIKQVFEIPDECVIFAEVSYIDSQIHLIKHFNLDA